MQTRSHSGHNLPQQQRIAPPAPGVLVMHVTAVMRRACASCTTAAAIPGDWPENRQHTGSGLGLSWVMACCSLAADSDPVRIAQPPSWATR